jgi:hypothetical protein
MEIIYRKNMHWKLDYIITEKIVKTTFLISFSCGINYVITCVFYSCDFMNYAVFKILCNFGCGSSFLSFPHWLCIFHGIFPFCHIYSSDYSASSISFDWDLSLFVILTIYSIHTSSYWWFYIYSIVRCL